MVPQPRGLGHHQTESGFAQDSPADSSGAA